MVSFAALQKLEGRSNDQLQAHVDAEVARWFVARNSLDLLDAGAFPRCFDGDISLVLQSMFGRAALRHMLTKPGARGEWSHCGISLWALVAVDLCVRS